VVNDYELKSKVAAQQQGQRDGTQGDIIRLFTHFYMAMHLYCRSGGDDQCSREPAFICVHSLDDYPNLHCWVQEDGFFPFLADMDFVVACGKGSETYEKAVMNKKPFEEWIEQIKKRLHGN